MENKEFNVLSLFDGMSCGQIALNRARIDYNNYFASEIDKSAILVTQTNYPNTIQLGDIRSINVNSLPKIDLLIGGSPCQGFSFAGKKLNFEDRRSKLFFEYVRILKELKEINPNILFLLENVKMKQEYQNVISSHLGVSPIRINSSLVSACRRDRLYWTNIEGVTQPLDKGITFDDININNQQWIPQERVDRISSWKAQQKPLDCAIIPNTRAKVPCLTARGFNQYHSGMILVKENDRYRYLSCEEGELAQTVPLAYTDCVDSKERAKMLGNGWTVDVITHIFSFIKIGG